MIRKDHKITASEKAFVREIGMALNEGDWTKLSVRRMSEFDRTSEDPDICVDLLLGQNCPTKDITTYVSLDASLDEEPGEGELDHRIELVGAAQSRFADFINVFPGIAQLAWMNQWKLKEGIVIQNVFSDLSGARIPHALVARPKPWPGLMKRFVMDGINIEFWWVIPIHESERVAIEKKGAKSLLEAIHQGQVDPFKLKRKAAL